MLTWLRTIYRRFNLKALNAENRRLQNENQRLRMALGSAKHEASVATIGHDQLNRFIRVAIAAGAPKSLHIDAQIKWMADRIKELED